MGGFRNKKERRRGFLLSLSLFSLSFSLVLLLKLACFERERHIHYSLFVGSKGAKGKTNIRIRHFETRIHNYKLGRGGLVCFVAKDVRSEGVGIGSSFHLRRLLRLDHLSFCKRGHHASLFSLLVCVCVVLVLVSCVWIFFCFFRADEEGVCVCGCFLLG